jgi:hypothetical protein
MDDHVGRILCTGSKMEHRKDLRERIDGQPEPDHLCGAAQPCSQFVQLEMWEPEVAEGALMQGLCVLASASQPGCDRGLPVAEDTLCSGRIQPFGERRQHHCDLLRGGFQAVQGGVASSAESGVTGLATECLDLLSATMCAVSNQSVDVSVCDAEVRALVVGTGETLGIYPFRSTSPAFDLAPGAHRKRGRSHTRREGGGEAAGRTINWSARLEETLDFGVDGSYS